MRVLVTGGAGFIGSHVVEALTGAGHEVRVLDALLPCVHPGGVPPFSGDPGFEFVHGDVRDAKAVDDALRGVSAVLPRRRRRGSWQALTRAGSSRVARAAASRWPRSSCRRTLRSGRAM